jgi:hypothetical protein
VREDVALGELDRGARGDAVNDDALAPSTAASSRPEKPRRSAARSVALVRTAGVEVSGGRPQPPKVPKAEPAAPADPNGGGVSG